MHLTYLVPTRGLLGFRYQFLTATRGMGIMNTLFHGYVPLAGDIAARASGSLVAWEPGVTTTFGLKNAEERGMLFVGAGRRGLRGHGGRRAPAPGRPGRQRRARRST